VSGSERSFEGDADGFSVKPFVFLGPSLPVSEAQRILDAVYLPPVSMGDIYRLMASRPRVIAIIDGLFEQTPAVWHKEILFALSRGVRVLGASSMGALRAAELAAFGMEGVGEVFEAFHRGELEDDDEVAVAHAPAADGYRSLSDAMVNLRAGLREARDDGRISAQSHDRLVAAAKDLFYPDRSWPRLFAAAAGLGIASGELTALREQIARRRPDVKRGDAIRLLERLAADRQAGAEIQDRIGAGGQQASFDFEATYFWDQMILHEGTVGIGFDSGETIGDGADPDAVTTADLRRHVRIDRSRARDILGTALLLFLAEEQAMGRHMGSTTAAGGSAQEAAPPMPGSELLSSQARADLERGQRAIEGLLFALPGPVNRRLPAALAHLGRLEPTLIEIRRKHAILRSIGLRAAAPSDTGLTLDDLLAWYQRRFGPMSGTPEEHAKDLGFGSLEEFAAEVVLEYLVERG
jgi:hypothetical protein